MSSVLPSKEAKLSLTMGADLYEYKRAKELDDRRLYLYGPIETTENDRRGLYFDASLIEFLVEQIFEYNRQDKGVPVGKRSPIRLYINSPGGNVTEGFALVSAIEKSKTPVYTINVGQWASMAFLIGICGHRRFSLPYMTFLMHDGATITFGSTSKVQDRINFEKQFDDEVIKPTILRHSKMASERYDELARVEFYMLPEKAKEYGFIDEIVDDFDTIL